MQRRRGEGDAQERDGDMKQVEVWVRDGDMKPGGGVGESHVLLCPAAGSYRHHPLQ